jgi:hypothetical protein
MIKRILPIYRTGWFYLLLLLWFASYIYVSNGWLADINQANINVLYQTTSTKKSTDTKQVLSLYTPVDQASFDNIVKVLANYPNTRIVFANQPSALLLKKLKNYLRTNTRHNKIIIISTMQSSGDPVPIKESALFSALIDWFRYTSPSNISRVYADNFIFSPLNSSKKQSLYLLWQEDNNIYVNATGEVLKQLTPSNRMALKNNWQLSLLDPYNEKHQQWPLGFTSEVYTPTNAPHKIIAINDFITRYNLDDFTFLNDKPDYDVIVFVDKANEQQRAFGQQLTTIINQQYLYQNISAIFLLGLLIIIGIALLWFSRHLPYKKQLAIKFT